MSARSSPTQKPLAHRQRPLASAHADVAREATPLLWNLRSTSTLARPSPPGFLVLLAGSVLGLVALCVVQTLMTAHPAQPLAFVPSTLLVDDVQYIRLVAGRLGNLVRFETVCAKNGAPVNRTAFLALHAYLQSAYPLTHRVLRREIINQYSLLYTWDAAAGAESKKPAMMLAHLDVVPAESVSSDQWTHPSFSGDVDDNDVVWGRGTFDNKGNIIMMFESIEQLLQLGFQPSRRLYFGLGHDEEVDGFAGAHYIAQLLMSRGIELEFLLDEGTPITQNIVPGMSKYRIGLIGVAEKGMASFEMTVTSKGGHASMPPVVQPVGVLADVITRLLNTPTQVYLNTHFANMLQYLLPYRPWYERIILENSWLFGSMTKRQLLAKPSTAALLRTTYALTRLSGGVADNVLPGNVSVGINVRIVPGETVAFVRARLEGIIQQTVEQMQLKQIDPAHRVTISLHQRNTHIDASPISVARDDAYFNLIGSVIRGALSKTFNHPVEPTFKDVLVAPTLMVGNTDTRHFWNVTARIYRISFYLLTSYDRLATFHGINERMEAASVVRGIGALMELWKRL